MEHNQTLIEPKGGFRLHRIEIYNWGTFNNRVYILNTAGGTALLTGSNGSGKSTIVDALVTLLVPPSERSYNLASTSVNRRRGERDESSYVRGTYGRISEEESGTIRLQHLRHSNFHTVILIVFHNEVSGETMTLAQVFYPGAGETDERLKKFLVTAPRDLSIVEHFIVREGDMNALRRRLCSADAQVFDGTEFSKYRMEFSKRLGLRSGEALKLFGQIVSIKEIGGLTEFIRKYMLESPNVQEHINRLRSTFDDLTTAHDSIVRAKTQIDALTPIIEQGKQYDSYTARIAEVEHLLRAIPAYFYGEKASLLERALAVTTQALDEHRLRLQSVDERLEHLENTRSELDSAIRSDQQGAHLLELQREIDQTEKELQQRRRKADQYNARAKKLRLPLLSDAAVFAQNWHSIPQLQAEFSAQRSASVEKSTQVQFKIAELEKRGDTLQREIESLRQRATLIPDEQIKIRTLIAEKLEIDVDQFAFIGELVQVKTEAHAWEPVLQRLLRTYGLRLLVPVGFRSAVYKVVNSTNLKGLLEYTEVGEPRRAPTRPPARNSAVHLLEVRPNTPFSMWLEREIELQYDYLCCTNEAQFREAPRAITQQGLIKHSAELHRKDDRRKLGDQRDYVLGWNNSAKREAFEREFHQLEREYQQLEQQRRQLSAHEEQAQDSLQDIEVLLEYSDFTELDWAAAHQRLEEVRLQHRQLQQAADRIQELQAQLTATRADIDGLKRERDQTLKIISTSEADQAKYQHQLNETMRRAEEVDVSKLLTSKVMGDIREWQAKQSPFTLETINDAQRELERNAGGRITALRGYANTAQREAEKAMVTFRQAFPQEGKELVASVQGLDDYRHLYARVNEDDLPRHETRFRELMTETTGRSVTTFSAALTQYERNYQEIIRQLNESLEKIDYSPTTYIRLTAQSTRNQEVISFRQELKRSVPDVGAVIAQTTGRNGANNPAAVAVLEESYHRIRKLIERFDQDVDWMRRVTNVRNWLDFAAEERRREGGQLKETYTDSSGKSGGQKAKLAYTILASAVAHQYNLKDPDAVRRSFRFLVIDEAFSKSDDSNARYAMDLFRQLDLQVLVVTPMDKTQVVEPYIGVCHWVWNNAEGNDSRAADLTYSELERRKMDFFSSSANPTSGL